MTRNIIFSSPMIRAILAGSKSQTRRIINGAPDGAGFVDFAVPGNCGSGCKHTGHDGFGLFFAGPTVASRGLASVKCPYGIPGDRIWLRERWKTEELEDGSDGIRYDADGSFRRIDATEEAADLWVVAHDNGKHAGWRSPIFMPRWCSRIDLEITKVRVQRLNAITELDALAEGIEPFKHDPEGDCWTARADVARSAFEYAWCDLHGWEPNAWGLNPWVWCLTFKVAGREDKS